MNKKTYEQPTMTVVRLQPHTRVLVGSNGAKMRGSRQNYTPDSSSAWDTED